MSLLLERGVISEVGPETGRKGPAPALYEVNADCAFAIGVDIGHKKIRAAIADVTGRVRARAEQEGPSDRDALIERVLAMCEDLAGQMGIALEAVRPGRDGHAGRRRARRSRPVVRRRACPTRGAGSARRSATPSRRR